MVVVRVRCRELCSVEKFSQFKQVGSRCFCEKRKNRNVMLNQLKLLCQLIVLNDFFIWRYVIGAALILFPVSYLIEDNLPSLFFVVVILLLYHIFMNLT